MLRFDDGAELTVSVTETGEFMVNANISGDHTILVSAYGDGNFVTTWYDENRDDVYAQNYNILGDPIGGEYRVNTRVTENPEVTSLEDGSYVITWARYRVMRAAATVSTASTTVPPATTGWRVRSYDD